MMIKKIALNVEVMNQDLRGDFGLTHNAERELSTLEKRVSPQLYGMLEQQLLGFHRNMQQEMAEDLVIFTFEHIAHTTGCASADVVLDICYTWIAQEQGIVKKGWLMADGREGCGLSGESTENKSQITKNQSRSLVKKNK